MPLYFWLDYFLDRNSSNFCVGVLENWRHQKVILRLTDLYLFPLVHKLNEGNYPLAILIQLGWNVWNPKDTGATLGCKLPIQGMIRPQLKKKSFKHEKMFYRCMGLFTKLGISFGSKVLMHRWLIFKIYRMVKNWGQNLPLFQI